MSDVKYEPIFGDQSLFDGAPYSCDGLEVEEIKNGWLGIDISGVCKPHGLYPANSNSGFSKQSALRTSRWNTSGQRDAGKI